MKAILRVKFDKARSVNNLKMAIEGVLLEEWPLIRRRATFLIHEQKEETYEAFLQDLKDLGEFSKFQDRMKWTCKKNCEVKHVVCSMCGEAVRLQMDELIAQLFWNGLKNKSMKQTIITKLSNTKKKLNTSNALDVNKNSTIGKKNNQII